MRPGDDKKVDSEYTRNGTCSIFAFIEPLGGTHHVSVREHRTAKDWAEEIRYLCDVMYPDARRLEKAVARVPGVTYCLLSLLTNSIKVRLRSVLIN